MGLGIIDRVVYIVLAIILFVDVVIPTLLGANTTGWTSPMTALFGVAKLLGVVVIVALLATDAQRG